MDPDQTDQSSYCLLPWKNLKCTYICSRRKEQTTGHKKGCGIKVMNEMTKIFIHEDIGCGF